MRRQSAALLVLPGVLVLASCGAEAESEFGASICDSCTVELRPVAALEFSNAPISPSMFTNLERLSDGTFVLVDWARGTHEILHFSSSGTYLGSHLQRGEGPGEAVQPQALLAVGDSLWILDSDLGRCTLVDAGFDYLRSFRCPGSPMDAAQVDGALFVTGFGPMGLIEYGSADGGAAPSRTEGTPVAISDDYATVAAGTDGVWYVAHPNQYRVTYWRPGEEEPSRVVEREPVWWQSGEPFLTDRWPDGRRGPIPDGEQRQVMRGPLLFNIAVSDGFVWTASYVYARRDRQYFDFLNDWLDQGLQGDVRVFLEALTPEGELVAAIAFDDLAPPRFTSDGLLYTLDKEGPNTAITVYQPKVVRGIP